MQASEIRKWRRDRSLNQTEFAALLDVSRQTVVNWEKGHHRPPKGFETKLLELVIPGSPRSSPPADGFMSPKTHGAYYAWTKGKAEPIDDHPFLLLPGRWSAPEEVPAAFLGTPEHQAAIAAQRVAREKEQEKQALEAYARALDAIESTWPHSPACRCWPCHSIAWHDHRYGTTTTLKGIPRNNS